MRLYAAIVERASEAVVVADVHGIVQYGNAAVRTILGHDPAALIGTCALDLVHPDEVGDAAALFTTTAARPGVKEPVEVRLRHHDGTYRYVEVVATNMVDDDAVQGIVWLCRDSSARMEAQRRFRTLFEQSPVALALLPPDLDGIIANGAFARLFETTREELLRIPPEDLVHPDDRPEMLTDRLRLESGDVVQVHAQRRYIRRTGEVFDGRVAATASRFPDGGLEHLLVAIEDVTVYSQATHALAASEARFRALVDNSPDIVVIIYPDGTWEANEQGTRILGYPKGFDPPGGVLSLVHPDDAELAATALGEVVAGTRTVTEPIALRLQAIDGTYREFDCVGRNLGDDAHVGGVVINARDVTERRRAERALRAAEERFRVVFERAPVAISIVDLDGNLVDVNPAACALLGRAREALVGQPAETAVHPDDRDRAIEMTMRQLAGGATRSEFRLLDAEGNERWVLSNAAMVEPSEPGADAYVVTLQADITDRRQLEAELEHRATRDALTGLLNRAAITELVDTLLKQRDRIDVALMFIDLDRFKAVNDTFGHAAGDAALRITAQRLVSTVRAGDM